MNSETKQCQNCKNQFTIEPEDFAFYAKIKVPPPTFCPECRMVRRMTFRNERSLYKRKCDAPAHNEEIISIYHKDSPVKVYDQKYWWSDEWDPMEYGRDYDFNKPFFEQFYNLMRIMPMLTIVNMESINCDYSSHVWRSKNCYLCIFSGESEDCAYCDVIFKGKNIIDSTWVMRSDKCYWCINCSNSYNTYFCQNINNCLDSYFLYNCKNCSNCFGCVNLRNKQYHIFNKPYSKEEYKKKLEEFDLGNSHTIEELKQRFQNYKLQFLHRYAYFINCINVVGNNVANSRNCANCFDIEGGVENSKNIILAGLGLKDSYDIYNGGTKGDLFYESIDVGEGQKIFFVNGSFRGSFNISYSQYCYNSSNIFGCIGLRNKQYCIFNKQYSKEEYEKLVPKIIEHMNSMPYTDKKGRIYKYGEFFPSELSPFSYNETIAQEYFPLTKEQALEKGYSWKNPEERNIKPDIKTEQLPDHIKEVKDDILDKVIQCGHSKIKEDGTLETACNEQCVTAFKIIKPELEFYRKMNLPLPRLCPNCRHYQRIKQRNPLKLWHRKCQCNGEKSNNGVYQNTIQHFHGTEPCPNEFETTYAPERPEIVYCEKCYQAEVI
jgi:hypothetical protein